MNTLGPCFVFNLIDDKSFYLPLTPLGSGNTSFVKELVRRMGNEDAIWIQIDDQMDSKSMLGAYVCTSVPGEFRWQPGPLAEVISPDFSSV